MNEEDEINWIQILEVCEYYISKDSKYIFPHRRILINVFLDRRLTWLYLNLRRIFLVTVVIMDYGRENANSAETTIQGPLQTAKPDRIHVSLLRCVFGCVSMWRCIEMAGSLKTITCSVGRKSNFNIAEMMAQMSRWQMAGESTDPQDMLLSGVRVINPGRTVERNNWKCCKEYNNKGSGTVLAGEGIRAEHNGKVR